MTVVCVLSHLRKWLWRVGCLMLLVTLSCGGGGGNSEQPSMDQPATAPPGPSAGDQTTTPARPQIVACSIEGEPFDCFAEEGFVLDTVTPTAEIQFSKPIRPETTLDTVVVCAESLLSLTAVSAPLRASINEGLAEVAWVDGNTRLQVTVLGNQDVQLRDGSLVGVVVTLSKGVFSVDGGELEPTEIGPLIFEIDLTGRGRGALESARDLRFCPI